MCGTRVLRSLAALFLAAVVAFGYSGPTVAQSTNQDIQERMRQLQQQLDELSKQLKSMKEEQAKTAQQVSATAKESSATAKTVTAADKTLSAFMKGFFGTLDVSIDGTTKGMDNFTAYHFGSAPNGGPPYPNNGPKAPPGPYGKVGWLPMMASNGSNIGYRGSHKIGNSNVEFTYQVSTAIDMAAAPGLANTWTKSSNTVQGAIGLGDTWVGLRSKSWGQLRFGEMYTPYKTSTDRLNPFAGMLGNYSTIIGNSGGDNRIEFGTRQDHVITYLSPSFSGFSFDASYGFAQNVDPYNTTLPLGSTDCAGANNPGSGNLFLNCDDGAWSYTYGGDLKFEMGGLYLVAAYELHGKVNRSSDGIGSNNPFYGALPGSANCSAPNNSPLLDCATYLAFAAEFPQAAAVSTPPFNPYYDSVDEWGAKIGAQYHFGFGLTVSYLWEKLERKLPAVMEFQDERTRPNAQWVAVEYELPGGADRFAAGFAHAGATPGDPGGQHNYNPNLVGQNQANMYTFAYWHKFDKQLLWYVDWAETLNYGNAHYDIGAGSHGIKTDCHDATHASFIDYSSAGPTTWGGCHPQGFSTGLNFKF
jgi:predicted porin